MSERPVNENFFDRIADSIRNSLGIKLFVIFFISLMLLIPVSMIKSLINEREYRKKDVISEVSSKWGNSQTIAGPLITIPYRKYYKTEKGETRYSTEYAHFLPKTLAVKGRLVPEKRYRGIYEIAVYNAVISVKGSFDKFDFKALGVPPENAQWGSARLAFGITDVRGIKEKVSVKVNGEGLRLEPGIHSETQGIISSGVSGGFPASFGTARYDFDLALDLNGSGNLLFAPLGEETSVELDSTWADPSFDGAFLPVEREINKDGFKARWKVLYFNRSFPQSWTGEKYSHGEAQDVGTIPGSVFGVKLYTPLEVYQKTTRTAKYAILFIGLTFVAFFFSEILNRERFRIRVHPVQYLLVGFALVVFYSLLLSLSEHLSFSAAYLASALAIVSMVTLYSLSVLKERRLSAIVCGLLSFLYVYFYIILLSEDYALVMGSLLVFAALAAIMYMTRKMDWYSARAKKGNENP